MQQSLTAGMLPVYLLHSSNALPRKLPAYKKKLKLRNRILELFITSLFFYNYFFYIPLRMPETLDWNILNNQAYTHLRGSLSMASWDPHQETP